MRSEGVVALCSQGFVVRRGEGDKGKPHGEMHGVRAGLRIGCRIRNILVCRSAHILLGVGLIDRLAAAAAAAAAAAVVGARAAVRVGMPAATMVSIRK